MMPKDTLPAAVLPHPEENLLDSWAANRVAEMLFAVAGRLYLTDRRVVFYPNKAYAYFGSEPWWCPHYGIARVHVQPKSPDDPYRGSRRNRLRIDIDGGGRELYVVNRPELVTERLLSALQTA